MNIESFCSRLESPVLKETIGALFGDERSMPDFPVIGVIMMLAFMYKGSCGYPIGGSLEFARAIEQRYLGLGGRIRYRTKVDKILVEQATAAGVIAKGEEHRSDEVISCADGHATLYAMLEGRYLSPDLRTAYETYPLFPSLIYVCLGIGKDLSDRPVATIFPLKKAMILEDGALTIRRLGLRLFHFDPTTAPPGKTAATVMIESRGFDFWTGLRQSDPARYREEKNRIGEMIVEAVEAEIGGIKPYVDVVDVATPATWHRYTGNWQGSYEGFLPTRKTLMKNLGFTVPGLENFYMHGQWVAVGGGLPPAGTGGRALAKLICRKHGRKFRTVP